MAQKLSWGILGTARIVRKVIPALQASSNGEVVGIASRTEAKAKEYAEKHGLPQAYGSYDALWPRPRSTPSTCRYPIPCISSGP